MLETFLVEAVGILWQVLNISKFPASLSFSAANEDPVVKLEEDQHNEQEDTEAKKDLLEKIFRRLEKGMLIVEDLHLKVLNDRLILKDLLIGEHPESK